MIYFILTTNFDYVHTYAGILRYKVDFQSLQADELLEDFDLDDY